MKMSSTSSMIEWSDHTIRTESPLKMTFIIPLEMITARRNSGCLSTPLEDVAFPKAVAFILGGQLQPSSYLEENCITIMRQSTVSLFFKQLSDSSIKTSVDPINQWECHQGMWHSPKQLRPSLNVYEHPFYLDNSVLRYSIA